jgi:hypothetical protein
MSLKAYKKYHEGLLMIIDHTIREEHGVQCYLDGDISNTNPSNVIILHICNVLNIAKCKRLGLTIPEVVIPSGKFERIPDTIKNRLTDHLIKNTLLT